jgi:hypothetical protein
MKMNMDMTDEEMGAILREMLGLNNNRKRKREAMDETEPPQKRTCTRTKCKEQHIMESFAVCARTMEACRRIAKGAITFRERRWH